MALLEPILSTENVSPAKINDCIQVVNSTLGLGTIGQRLVKGSSNDFDTAWANPENIGKYTGASFSLSTMLIGEDYNFNTIHSSFVGNANQTVKFFSLANPSKFIIVNIESGTTSTNLVGRVTFNNNISDTTLISDWVIVPYNYQLRTFNSDNQSVFVANELFSALALTNCTLDNYNVNCFKEGNKVTINGKLDINCTGSSPRVNFTLTDKYLIADGNTYDFIFNSSARLIASSVHSSITSICDNVSVGVSSESLLGFRSISTIASGNFIGFTFSFSYIAKNYSA